MTLEDLHGRTEVVVFPKELAEYRDWLVPDAVVFFEGTVDRKREDPSVRTTRAIPLAQAIPALATALLLDVDSTTPVDKLVEILGRSGGTCSVYLNVPASGDMIAQIECHPRLRVTCDPELIQSLVELLGAAAVSVLGPTRRMIPLSALTDSVPSGAAAQ